jgi:hypothetical protein
MPKTYIHVHSNPLPGKEAEYNSWYENVHLPELLQVEGVKAYQRFVLATVQMNDKKQSHKYLIQMEIDSDDIPETISRMYAAHPTMRMEPVADFANLELSVVQVVTEEVRKT